MCSCSCSAQTYLKVADKAEYAKYLEYCNTAIDRDFTIIGKVTVLKVNGQYSDSLGNWFVGKSPVIVWVKYGTKSISFSEKQHMIAAKVTLKVKRRESSIDDFYKLWQTGFIQAGLIDERSGVY